MMHNVIAMINAVVTIFFTSFWSNVFSLLISQSVLPIRPISVAIPIFNTLATHCHWTTMVPENMNGWSSPPGLHFKKSIFSAADFLTGTDSPVRSDSSILQFLLRRTTQSAGTLSPSCMMTISSLTTSLPAILICSPFLMTKALGLERSLSAASALSVLFSW